MVLPELTKLERKNTVKTRLEKHSLIVSYVLIAYCFLATLLVSLDFMWASTVIYIPLAITNLVFAWTSGDKKRRIWAIVALVMPFFHIPLLMTLDIPYGIVCKYILAGRC